MIKTAVFGGSGYIGSHLLKKYRSIYPDCLGTSFQSKNKNLTTFDIRNPNIDLLKLEHTGHKAAIITSAKPNIAYCEKESSKSYEVNVSGTIQLIKNLSKTSLKIIFLSSDYVFNGISGNYSDDDKTNPITAYGKHKKKVEDEIKKITDNFLVLRLSKIYGLKKGDNTILDETVNNLKQNKQVLAADNQFFCPTFIDDLINAIIQIQGKNLKGFINLCAPESWSRFDMMTLLAQMTNQDISLVKKIKLYDIKEMQGRPLNTTMTCKRLNREVEAKFISLKDAMVKIVNNYKSL
jgi:dTDP-4-dehydrorhamnose reductase